MYKRKICCLIAGLLFVHFSLAVGGGRPGTPQQNLGKRPMSSQPTTDKTDQVWEGATLRSDVNTQDEQESVRKRQFRQQLNMQFSSKRPYIAPDSE